MCKYPRAMEDAKCVSSGIFIGKRRYKESDPKSALQYSKIGNPHSAFFNYNACVPFPLNSLRLLVCVCRRTYIIL